MFVQCLKMEVKGANDRIYRFECEATSPLGEINDVLTTMKGVVVKQIQDQYEKETGSKSDSKECCQEKSDKKLDEDKPINHHKDAY